MPAQAGMPTSNIQQQQPTQTAPQPTTQPAQQPQQQYNYGQQWPQQTQPLQQIPGQQATTVVSQSQSQYGGYTMPGAQPGQQPQVQGQQPPQQVRCSIFNKFVFL